MLVEFWEKVLIDACIMQAEKGLAPAPLRASSNLDRVGAGRQDPDSDRILVAKIPVDAGHVLPIHHVFSNEEGFGCVGWTGQQCDRNDPSHQSSHVISLGPKLEELISFQPS